MLKTKYRYPEYQKQYQEANKDKIAAKSKQWYAANKEHVKKLRKIRYENNKDYQREQSKKWRLDNPERYALLSRNRSLMRTFGITPDQYDGMRKNQDYKCSICKRHESEFSRALSVDHCHKTNKIRALLCNKCNAGLGMFTESQESLTAAVEYLKKYAKA